MSDHRTTNHNDNNMEDKDGKLPVDDAIGDMEAMEHSEENTDAMEHSEEIEEEDYEYDEDDFEPLSAGEAASRSGSDKEGEDLSGVSGASGGHAADSRRHRARHVALLRAALAVVLVLAAAYVIGCVYFSSHFMFNTTLNGTDVSLKSADDVEALLADAADDYVLTIEGRGDVTDTIYGTDISLEPVLTGEIGTLIGAQNSLAWPVSLFSETAHRSDSTASYDEAALTEVIAGLAFYEEANITEASDATYTRGADGYEIVAETEGTRPDTEGLTAAIVTAIEGFAAELVLDDSCYEAASVMSDDAVLNATVTALNNLLETEVTLVLADEASQTLSGEELLAFLTSEELTAVTVSATADEAADADSAGTDEESAEDASDDEEDASSDESGVTSAAETLGTSEITLYTLSFDEDLVEAYVDSLADEYDTYGNSHVFNTTSGETVTVPGGNYGWRMDVSSTAAALIELLSSGESGSLSMDVVWSQTAQVFGEDDIGDTYAEVDLDEQKVYLYVDGELVLSTDCVSGKASDSSRYTPDGVFRLAYRTSPATLTGADYESYVTYWMPFNNGIGFHDASWRSSFGGSIYISNGSHGCINLPTSAAKTLYSYAYSGMPVIVFGGMTPSEAQAYIAEQEAEEAAAAQSEEEAAIIAQAIANYMALGMTEEEATAQVEADLAAQLAEQQAAAASES